MESHIEKKEKKIPEKNDKKDNLHPNIDQQNHQKHKKEKKRREYKVFYSDYGYIKIDKKDLENLEEPIVKFIQYKFPPYKRENCLVGTIFRENFHKDINFKIKTFYGKREIFNLNKIEIFSNLGNVITDMIEKNSNEKISDNEKNSVKKKSAKSQYTIFSCHKKIHELNPSKNIFENDIQKNELLLYLPPKILKFSEYIKGRSILLTQENKIATKIHTDDPQYILGDIMYSFGKHYFEIYLLTEPIAQSVIIGLATKKSPFDLYINDVNNFYGFILSDMKKISVINGRQQKSDYGKEEISINDVIGVLFEFKKDGLEISFYKNKVCLGVAFKKIEKDKYFFPAVNMGLAGSKIRITNQIDFP